MTRDALNPVMLGKWNELRDRRELAVAGYCNLIWANAFGTAPLGKPEPRVAPRLGPSGECRLSQGEK